MLKTSGHGVLAQNVSTSRGFDLGKVSLIPPGTGLSSFMLCHKLLGRCMQKSCSLQPMPAEGAWLCAGHTQYPPGGAGPTPVLTQLEQRTGGRPGVLLEIL